MLKIRASETKCQNIGFFIYKAIPSQIIWVPGSHDQNLSPNTIGEIKRNMDYNLPRPDPTTVSYPFIN